MKTYDIIIIGAGPAGLTAAIYASRARLKTLVIESFTTPGQAIITSDIENYPGFPKGLNGFELIDRFKKQALKFGAETKTGEVKKVSKEKNNEFKIKLENEEYKSLAIIIATGSRPKKLGIPKEEEFRGKGVSYCATCDGAFFKEKEIVLVGGGNTAIEEALFLTKFAKSVKIIHRRDRLRATKILQEKAFANKKIEFIWDSQAMEIKGKDRVNAVRIRNIKTNEEKDIPCSGVFMFVGYIPNTDFVKDLIKVDENGYIIADENMHSSEKGIFIAGDVRKKLLRQVVTASGDGALAAVSARLYIDELKGTVYK